MTKTKSTKRALLMSALALLMCVSMLIGSTFAWFTDSVTSGVNKITAGNLDVELDYYTGSEWKTVSNATELFTGNLWEPGHTEVVYLRMTNKGTLAVKYQLGVNIVSETTGTNVYDDTLKLSDYIYYDVIENKQPSYADRADAIADVNDEAKINEVYSKSGTMTTQNEELYLALVVYMPETVGNEANYKTGTTAPEINLGINLLATQYTYESDSFNNQYDKDAIYYDVSVNDSASLVAAVKAGNDIIAIDGSITLTSSMNASGVTFIGMNDDAAIDFGTYGVFGSDITYRNLTLDNDRDGWYNGMEYGNALNNTYIDCEFANGITTYGNSTFKGCTFNELPAGNYALFAYAGSTITVEDCVFNYGDRAIKIYSDYGNIDVKMTVSNTAFKASDTTVANKAMIEIDDSLMNSVNVTVTDITIDNAIAANGVYRIDDGDLDTSTTKSVVTVNGAKTFVSTAEDLTAAIKGGADTVILGSGDYNMVNTTGDVTISGTKDTVIDLGTVKANNLTLEGVTVVGSGYGTGVQGAETVSYNNVTIEGDMCLYGDKVEFNNCTFNLTVDQYIWTYGASVVEFNNCTFNSQGKALLVYGDYPGDLSTTCTTYINNCKFYAENAVEGKAAIEIDSRFINQVVYIDSLTTAEGFDEGNISSNSLWNNKKGNAAKVYVNSVEQSLNTAPNA